MNCYKSIDTGGYIIGIGKGHGSVEITESEYDEILSAIRNCPTAPSGYTYRLKTDLTWELCELPAEEETEDDEATSEDLENAFRELGVMA